MSLSATDDVTMIGVETFICEDGEVVGTTGVVNVEDERILPTEGRRPKLYKPIFTSSLNYGRATQPFDVDDPVLVNAARATACLIVDHRQPDGKLSTSYGTAFFVADTLLLTAGHNLISRNGTIERIGITYAGCKIVDRESNSLDCKILYTLYNGPPDSLATDDIAILECFGHATKIFLPLARTVGGLFPGAVVDVIAYPGTIQEKWLEEYHQEKLDDYIASAKDARGMLQPKTLTVTRGPIVEIKDGLISYKLSTCRGMSGGCLIFQGEVYGICYIGKVPTLIIGVHLGQLSRSDGKNYAISFSGSKVCEMLRERLLDTKVSRDGDYLLVNSLYRGQSS